MAKFILSQKSLGHLEGIHPDLVRVVKRAIELSRSVDFGVLDGLRTEEEERKHVKEGTSQTMNSRHLTGHAVDLVPYNEEGKPIIGKLGNDPANWQYFATVSRMMKTAALDLKIPISWGGDWSKPNKDGKVLKDGYHYELTWAAYPLK